MEYEIRPEPSAAERAAIDRAAEELLRDDEQHPAYASEWRRRGIADNLGDGALAEEGGGDADVVQARDPRQHQRR